MTAITINGDFNPWDIPPQTITEPSPNLYLSRTKASAKRSPRRRPSGQKRVNRELICKKDTSPLPHWKLYGTMCRQPSHTMRATFTSERKTNVRSTSSETNLAQSVSHSFWVNVAIMIAYRSYSGFSGSNVAIAQVGKKNSPVLTWCRYARTSPSRASATLLVSLRRRTRRSTVETFTPNCKATCCCIWPCISNAIAWPLWTSVSRDMITRDSN